MAVTIPATILGDPAILSPENVVAVIIPAPASTPDELMVTTVPTIAVDIVAIPDADTFSAVIPILLLILR